MWGRAVTKLSAPSGPLGQRPGHLQLGPAVCFPQAPRTGCPVFLGDGRAWLRAVSGLSCVAFPENPVFWEPSDLSWVGCAAGGARSRADPPLGLAPSSECPSAWVPLCAWPGLQWSCRWAETGDRRGRAAALGRVERRQTGQRGAGLHTVRSTSTSSPGPFPGAPSSLRLPAGLPGVASGGLGVRAAPFLGASETSWAVSSPRGPSLPG